VIGVAVHEANMLAVGHHLQDITGEQCSSLIGPIRPVQNRAAIKMSAHIIDREIPKKLLQRPFSEVNVFMRVLYPLPIVFVDEDRDIPKCLAPLHHRSVIMVMRDGDCIEAAQIVNKTNRPFINEADTIPQ